MKKRFTYLILLIIVIYYTYTYYVQKNDTSLSVSWEEINDRTWAGQDFWANRLQDWRVHGGRLECVSAAERKPMRTVHILSRYLGRSGNRFEMSVETGLMKGPETVNQDCASGFLIGCGRSLDYRAAALIHHSYGPEAGIFAGLDADGNLLFKDFTKENAILDTKKALSDLPDWYRLRLKGSKSGNVFDLEIAVFTANGSLVNRLELEDIDAGRMVGNIALVSHPGSGGNGASFWFDNLKVSGGRIMKDETRQCGPVLSTQYTLSKNVMKLTAQLMPVSKDDPDKVMLELQKNGQWGQEQVSTINPEGYTAPFRLTGWDDTDDVPFRIVYQLQGKKYFREGTIRKNPVDKEEIVVAAFTGNHNVTRPVKGKWAGVDGGWFPWTEGVWFPHNHLIENVKNQNPDVLFFSGDQVYEGASPTGADVKHIWNDYLYKWYLWCWAFRDLTRDIPAVTIPDDHDVFHGNLWGAGGKPTLKGASGAKAQDSGGYKYAPEWVNMVQRTQTSHLPDPYDPAPVKQGISVYYCDMNYGGVSFAVIEDRKFKSAPKVVLPEADVYNGWAQNSKFNPKKQADVPGAKLLGERQLKFLNDWAIDWSGGAWMKVVLSQTIFSTVATLPYPAKSDAVVPRLPVLPLGEYAENDIPVSDMDSDGWPQTGRNNALKAMRKGFAIHIAGDQHLGSSIQYGVEDFNDAGYALCVPSVANFWPRRWYPREGGNNREPGAPKYTGEFEDGFGNKMTVHAVSNPHKYGHEPEALHDLAAGYGIVRLNRKKRTVQLENWPRWADPLRGGKPYAGWPVIAKQTENYGKKPAGFLPEIKIAGMNDPVIQVIEEASGETIYALRINGTSFKPFVFTAGTYTVKIGEPDENKIKEITGLRITANGNAGPVIVNF